MDSLTYHVLDPSLEGTYHYVPAANIFSYMIQERTGMTPEEFAVDQVFTRLGITKDDYNWHTNEEGLTLGLHGLYMTTHAYSKLGMLYLQGGMINENERLVEQSWIDRTFTVGDENADVPFGYLWWIDGDSIYCSKGFGGQRMCINTANDRVIVVMSDNYDEKISEWFQGEDAAPQNQLVEMFLGT